jgi:PleD family two-component response regulator
MSAGAGVGVVQSPRPFTMEDPAKQPAVLLIATESEWAGRSLESVFVAHRYSVVRAEDGHVALATVRERKPDAIILDEHLPGIGGIEVCKRLRDDPSFDPATPIIVTASAPASRSVKTAAFAAGAWDFCTQPIDANTLLLELQTFIRAKRRLAEARAQSFVDASTGLLSPLGMEHWADHMTARAARNHEPLACVMLTPTPQTAPAQTLATETVDFTDAVEAFLDVAREYFRRSDIVGRMSEGRLALLAPDTDAAGVHGLLARLRSAIDANAPEQAPPTDFRAGYWAVRDFAVQPLEPAELLRRAARALDHVTRLQGPELVIGFDQLPMS